MRQIIDNAKKKEAKIKQAQKEFEDCVKNSPKVAEYRDRLSKTRADFSFLYEFGGHEVVHFGIHGAAALTAGNMFVVVLGLIVAPDIIYADENKALKELVES